MTFQGFLLPIMALTMKAGSTSKTSVNFFQTTRRNIPEDSHLPYGLASRPGILYHVEKSYEYRTKCEADGREM
jgi:hypothetical protein